MKNTFSANIRQSLNGRSSPPDDDTKKQIVTEKENSPQMVAEPKTTIAKKHPGGRPTNKSRGLQKRKQITITMSPEMYEETLKLANEEGLSLAKYIERAIIAYQKNS